MLTMVRKRRSWLLSCNVRKLLVRATGQVGEPALEAGATLNAGATVASYGRQDARDPSKGVGLVK